MIDVRVNRSLAAARAYVARGLAVFPLNNKVPVTPNGVKDATTDLVQVEAWFDHTRNIGIAVPPNVVIVDIDPRNGGNDQFVEWCDAYGWPEDVPEARTGGDGYHFWFKYDGGKLVKTINGVDFLRVGKYVVAPPSVTAKPYTWFTQIPKDLADLPVLPGWLRQIATPEEREFDFDPVTTPSLSGEDALDAAAHKYCDWESLLARHGWKRVGNDKWRRPGTENPISATIKYDCLFVYTPNTPFPETSQNDAHGVTLYNGILKLDFNDDQRAMLQAFRDSGYLDVMPRVAEATELVPPTEKKPSQDDDAPDVDWFADDDDWLGDTSSGADVPDEYKYRLLVATDLHALKRKDEDIERRWLVEPIIAVERAHALYAGAKTGKSLLLLPLAAAAATGRPFLDHPGGEPIKVVYADYEMTEDDLKERLEGFGYDLDDELLNEYLAYCFVPASNGLDTPAGGADFVGDALEGHHAQLVVVDTLSRAVVGAENDSDTIRNFYRHTGWPLKRAGASVIRLDHAGKDATKGQRGTSGKNDDVDVVWELKATGGKEPDALFTLKATHARMGWVDRTVDLTFRTHPDTGSLS